MARVVPTAQAIGPAGAVVNMTAPTVDGDAAPTGTDLLVMNDSGASITVTIESTYSVDGLDLPDRTLAVAAGALARIPVSAPTAARAVGDVDSGLAYVDFSAFASVTRAYVKNA